MLLISSICTSEFASWVTLQSSFCLRLKAFLENKLVHLLACILFYAFVFLFLNFEFCLLDLLTKICVVCWRVCAHDSSCDLQDARASSEGLEENSRLDSMRLDINQYL
jgi:hypothetical protein